MEIHFIKYLIKIRQKLYGNVASITLSDNRTILNPDVSLEYRWNCRSRNKCPLQNKGLTPKIVYCANVESDIKDKMKLYFGIFETPFKERSRNV